VALGYATPFQTALRSTVDVPALAPARRAPLTLAPLTMSRSLKAAKMPRTNEQQRRVRHMPSKSEKYKKRNVYGWSAKVDFILNSAGGFRDVDNPHVCPLWSDEYILTLASRKIDPDFEGSGTSGYRLTIEATNTASEAEILGTKLAFGLLSIAVERIWGLSLAWPDTPLPCRVIDRTAPAGAVVQGFGSTTNHITLEEFTQKLKIAFNKLASNSYRLLLSMELCASSQLEQNSRSRLIMLVSAVKALAEQQDLEGKIGHIVPTLKCMLKIRRSKMTV